LIRANNKSASYLLIIGDGYYGFFATALKIRPSNCCLRGGLYHVIMAPRSQRAMRERDHSGSPATPHF